MTFCLVSVNCVTTSSNMSQKVSTCWEIKHCILLEQETFSFHRVGVPILYKMEVDTEKFRASNLNNKTVSQLTLKCVLYHICDAVLKFRF